MKSKTRNPINNLLFRCTDNSTSLETLKFKYRPYAGHGVWVLFLLPIALIKSCLRYDVKILNLYQMACVVSFGLLVTSAWQVKSHFQMYTVTHPLYSIHKSIALPLLVTVIWIYTVFERGLIFSLFSGFMASSVFIWIHVSLMRLCPLSFTFGEAGLVAQTLVLFMFCCVGNMQKIWTQTPTEDMDIATVILQVGLLGVLALCIFMYTIPKTRLTMQFYILCFIIFVTGVIPILHILLNFNPVLWIIQLLLNDAFNAVIIVYWLFCVSVAVFVIVCQIQKDQQASTATRKYFHILAVAVYLPGFIYLCCVLYLASGVVLAVFIVLELMRITRVMPLGKYLQDGFTAYVDEKDAGNLALTPIYLLCGCSLPLWLHPTPCTDPSSLLAMCSGLLSVGIGDTLASSIGSHCGRNKWPGTQKSIEGTVACILGQISVATILHIFGIFDVSGWNFFKLFSSILATSLVEAYTNQVDNLVLPLIGYIFLV